MAGFFLNVKSKGSTNAGGQGGKDGITPDIQIGEVTTLEPDQQATVTREGTNENPIFNFGIPRGNVGDTGKPGKDGATPDMSDFENKINKQYETIEKKIDDHIENHPQGGGSASIDDNTISTDKTWSSSKIEDFVLTNVGAIWQEINGGQMVIESTMDGFLREVEILGNTTQNQENLSNIQHLGVWNEEKQGYEIEIVISNSSSKDDLNYQEYRTTIVLPCQLMKVGKVIDRFYWDKNKGKYVIEKKINKTQLVSDKNFQIDSEYRDHYICYYNRSKIPNIGGGFLQALQLIPTIPSGIGSSTVTDTVGVAWGNNDYRLLVNKSVINDISEAREYFNSFSPYVYYPLSAPQLIDTDIREELKLPTFMNNTYISVNGGIQGYIKAKAPVDSGELIGSLQEENRQLKQMDNELVATSWDMDFRMCTIEWSLEDLGIGQELMILENNMKGSVSNMALSRYEQAKIMIVGGIYKKITLTKQLTTYFNRGYLTQEEYDELIALMEAKDLVMEE